MIIVVKMIWMIYIKYWLSKKNIKINNLSELYFHIDTKSELFFLLLWDYANSNNFKYVGLLYKILDKENAYEDDDLELFLLSKNEND
jgi:hypothetical protein